MKIWWFGNWIEFKLEKKKPNQPLFRFEKKIVEEEYDPVKELGEESK